MPGIEKGHIGLRHGPTLAASDRWTALFKGAGGHGSMPHQGTDPTMPAAQFIIALQTIVSRNSSPLDPAVITVGSFHSGAKHNIISDEAKLQLTVRSYSDESRKLLLDGIRRGARGAAMTAGLPDELMPE